MRERRARAAARARPPRDRRRPRRSINATRRCAQVARPRRERVVGVVGARVADGEAQIDALLPGQIGERQRRRRRRRSARAVGESDSATPVVRSVRERTTVRRVAETLARAAAAACRRACRASRAARRAASRTQRPRSSSSQMPGADAVAIRRASCAPSGIIACCDSPRASVARTALAPQRSSASSEMLLVEHHARGRTARRSTAW